jgi:hypothetical protein
VFVKIGLDERKKRAGVRKLSRRTNSSYGQEQRSRVRWDDAARQSYGQCGYVMRV